MLYFNAILNAIKPCYVQMLYFNAIFQSYIKKRYISMLCFSACKNCSILFFKELLSFYCVQSFVLLIFMLLESSNDIFCPLIMHVVNVSLIASKSF